MTLLYTATKIMVLVLSTDTFCVSYKYFPSGAKFIGHLSFYARCCANGQVRVPLPGISIQTSSDSALILCNPLGFESRRERGPDNFYSL